METILSETEIRVLGCLVEKEYTTPDYYPLTLNSLVHACNQKSNRDPVVNYDETTVEKALRGLQEKNLSLTEYLEAGTRVLKYGNRFADHFKLSRGETAILCELMLRGPQTPGELHSRAERMCPISSLNDVMEILKKLTVRTPPLIAYLPRQPGRKEIRYTHLFSGEPQPAEAAESGGASLQERIEALEKSNSELAGRIEALEKEIGELKGGTGNTG